MIFTLRSLANVSTFLMSNREHSSKILRGRMSGRIRICSSLLPVFVCVLQLCAVRVDAETPTVHPVLLQNETTIPEEYRNLPLVGKCCPMNEVLMKSENEIATCGRPNHTVESFSPLFSEFNRTGVMIPGDERDRFVAIVGDPCKFKRYMFFPEESSDDEHYLLMNGTVFAPHHDPIMLAPGVDYCMEVIPGKGVRTLVCFPEDLVIATADSRITIYAYGLLISVPFLVLTIGAYVITPKLRDALGKSLCNYCGCLAVAFSTLALTQLGSAYLSDEFCICIAFVIQFSFVACFFWLNVMCIETWALIRSYVNRGRHTRTKPKTLFFYYSLWGWGPPAILILISMAIDLSPTIPATYVKPNFGKESCWFKSDEEAMPYFYIPAGLLLLGNTVLFVMTSLMLTQYQQDLDLRRLARNDETDRIDQRCLRRLRRTFFAYLILFFLMGINWTMELVSWLVGGDPFDWSIFDLVNALQGVLVFGLFVLRRPPRDFIRHRLEKLRGVDSAEPEVCGLGMTLLPMVNGDVPTGQTIIS